MWSQYTKRELLTGVGSVHMGGVVGRCGVSTYEWSCWHVGNQYTKRELLTGVVSAHMGRVVGRCGVSTCGWSC